MFGSVRRSTISAAVLEALERAQATISFDLDGTILDANGLFLSLMGYTAEEVLGRHHRMFVDPDEARGPAYEEFWRRLRQGGIESAEFRRIAKGGRSVWIRATYAPVLDRKGRPVRIVKFALDVTAEKQAWAESAGQISAIDRSQAVIHFDLDGTITKANDNFLHALGYRADEVLGRHHRMFVTPEEAAGADYAAFWEGLRRGEFRSGEFSRVGKDGREVWIQATYNPIFDFAGRPFKVVKYASDITDEKLRASDFSGQIEAVTRSQAVVHFGMDGTVLDANSKFLEAVGYSLDEVKGRHHSLFVRPDYANSAAYRQFWDKLRAGAYSSAVYQRIGKGGREVWIQATYNPVLDAKGRPFKVVKFAFDVTKSMAVRSRAVQMAESTLGNVQAIAAAAEKMHATSMSVSEQMSHSRAAMDDIQARMATAEGSTAELRQAAQAMDGVVQAITAIAEKINLLALNATIEAARAGAAGRGFAIVASEVKDLAGQAKIATARISSEISAMQSISETVGGALTTIGAAVHSVHGFVGRTAEAIEQQRASTGEISANMQIAADGVGGIARSLDEWIVGVEERRDSERTRTSIPARISTDSETIDCRVLNISASGAKISVAAASVPDRFDLWIDGQPRHSCRVVRRDGTDLGVRFA